MTQPGRARAWASVDEAAPLHGFAHDLHNLLSVVITYVELARETLPDDHPAGADLVEIRAAARQAVALVNTLASTSLSSPHV